MKLIRGILAGLIFAVVCRVAEKPNIVLMVIDDWAWYGSPVQMDKKTSSSRMPIIKMPNFGRFARGGVIFRYAYAGASHAPLRVCIQTGQSSARNGFLRCC